MATRREFLQSTGCGFGALAFADLARTAQAASPLVARAGHHPARAKRVIFLFMQGGVSHVDSFDYKPALSKHANTMHAFDDARALANTGARGTSQRIMASPWKFQQHGQVGKWCSDLFPQMNQHVDKLCFLHGLHTEGVAHGPATLFLHCGSTNFIRPSMGSWMLYGLGTENQNLPGFVSIMPTSGNGGARNYGNAFLPATVQGTALGKAGGPAREAVIRHLKPTLPPEAHREQFELLRRVHAEQMKQAPGVGEYEAVAESFELAWRMQSQAPGVLDIAQESAATRELYGIGPAATDSFGRQCLMARRLCEQGVRYIQVTYGDGTANPAWDQHSNLPKHADHARAVDRPIAGLLTDLAQRGLLKDTLVWWGSEFGRTPYAEKNGTGRDHNPGGFTMWMAGAGVRPGFAFGATDEFGFRAIADKVHMHDLHATILHLMGLDHEKLTHTYAGRPFRLTDVHGHVVKEIISPK
ncbi:MAG: DUF1501 domain-containing protein [Gemmataceae bacterium]